MFSQQFDDSIQSLYFPHNDVLILIILSFIILISVGLIAVILLRNQKLTRKSKLGLLMVSSVFGGIILGGVPNVVLVLQHIFADLIFPNRWVLLVIRVGIFLGLTLIFGRIFCGYVCPLGAIQELASMVHFKPKLDYERKYWKKKSYLRWGFFIAYAIFSVIFGVQTTLFMNPINGFLIFWTPLNIMIFIAFCLFLVTIFISFFIYRPYCRFFCPFGALAAIFGRISPLKIRRTKYCNECGICEKICPTLEGFEHSNKGECYYCNRCIEFCTNEMFIDTAKIAQINRLLTTYSLDFEVVSREKFFDSILKNIIKLLIPYKRIDAFGEFIDALQGKKDMALDAIQNIVIRLRAIFPNEIKQINTQIYKNWIEKNEIKWKEKIEPINLDKLFYGLAKEKQ